MVLERDIEKHLIDKLVAEKYIYRPDIRTVEALDNNFREKFNKLNSVNLSDSEFERLKSEIITPDVFANADRLRKMNEFIRDDDTPLTYTLVNIRDWCKNDYEIVNQLRINNDKSYHRYDVNILINGIPVVHIELKTLDIVPRRAMEQIVQYKNDVGNGFTNTLMAFVQMFIVSNQTHTMYFANNDNEHFSFNADERFLPIYEYADKDNNPITGLYEFCETFLEKCTLGQTISRYMVLVASERKLMVMRPYQIYAVKAIVDSIKENRGNGYIWHTTGSGKTLTSFKASTLLRDNPDIEKCLFVVDRKDLDRQTREEFNRFQEKSVEENTNTATLVKRLLSTTREDKVIVTTIQKLGLALDPSNKKNYSELLKSLADKRMVFIFDECHRSQFGDNHEAIKDFFPNAQLFGFTGTPIFEKNSNTTMIENNKARFKTTEAMFHNLLHSYTITNAIEDQNVLRFHIDYFKADDQQKASTNKQLAKSAIIKAILDKHDSATHHRRFNALFATSSINDAIEYYDLFKKMQAECQADDENFVPLHIGVVFSPPAEGNADVKQLQEDLEQEKEDNKIEPGKKKQALKQIIDDYNQQFNTNFDLNNFDLYYQDVQSRIKSQKYLNRDMPYDKKLDIVIVVDMLLTGFDSQYLNTLYVDKNLRYHGLIQAFSRTNRVLNDTKPYGNVLDFRQQENEVDEAIKMFSGSYSDTAHKIWLVDTANVMIGHLDNAVKRLEQFMQAEGLTYTPEAVEELKGDTARAEFIKAFKEVQRIKTQLDQYTDLTEENVKSIESIIPNDTLQAFRGAYLQTAERLREKQDKNARGDGKGDEIDNLDFEFVLFSSAVIDYDYIMKLISKTTGGASSSQNMSREQLISMLSANANLREDRELIVDYFDSLDKSKPRDEHEIREGFIAYKAEKSSQELNAIANKHGLDIESLKPFVERLVWRKVFDGEELTVLLEPLELGWKARRLKEVELMEDLIPLLRKLTDGQEISGLEAYEL